VPGLCHYSLYYRDYLTGFSRRKRLRKKHAKQEGIKKEEAKKKEKRAEVKTFGAFKYH